MNSTTGKLEVIKRSENQYAIQHHPSIEDWDSCYFEVSGFFGTHKPELFAAAPEMYEALEHLLACRDNAEFCDEGDQEEYEKILAKARGEAL